MSHSWYNQSTLQECAYANGTYNDTWTQVELESNQTGTTLDQDTAFNVVLWFLPAVLSVGMCLAYLLVRTVQSFKASRDPDKNVTWCEAMFRG